MGKHDDGIDGAWLCDGARGRCTRSARVTIPKGPFTAELHFCRQHEKAFLVEADAFHRANR